MGTVAGVNTRRYHGLLVASLRPPTERFVLLSKIEENVSWNGRDFALGVCQYPGVVTPAGYRYLERFRLDPFPIWDYLVDDTHIEKKVLLVYGRQTVVIQYNSSALVSLRLRPFLAFRDYHSLMRATDAVRGEMTGGVIKPYENLPALRFQTSGGHYDSDPHWYYNVEYLRELDRGLDFHEDLYSPGSFVLEVAPDRPAWLVATIENDLAPDHSWIAEMECSERERRSRNRLDQAADQFVVRRHDGSPTIIAGYPWFTDWGRDTMISLPGLLIARGRMDEAREILAGFLKHLNQGLIPNRFPDHGETPEYNSVDATLWMFPAIHAWLEAGGDPDFIRNEVVPSAQEIIAWHRRGTHHDIHVDPADALLSAGSPTTQLTWMDAKVGDWVVTPRHGKPVEVNALWYNALRLTADWSRQYGDALYAVELEELAATVRESFERRFWNATRNCLYDVLSPDGPVAKLRPNQLFAVSLPYPLLEGERAQMIVEAVARELLTPVGLRTLERGDPDYRRAYSGSALERDGAYHQGTVWPWLLGPFITASIRVYGRTPETIACCRTLVESLAAEIAEPSGGGGLGSLAEIYTAEPPHHTCGTIAQAWSVAELIRILKLLDLNP